MAWGGKKQERIGAWMRMMGALEARGRWCFQARHVREIDNPLADGLTRWKEAQIPEKLKAKRPDIAW